MSSISASRRLWTWYSPTTALALLIVLGEWTGLARAVLGVPAFAAVLDLALVSIVVSVLLRRRTLSSRAERLLAALTIAYIGLATLQVLNPNVPDPWVGLQGLRKSAFTALALLAVLFAEKGQVAAFVRIVALGSLPAFAWSIRQAFLPVGADLAIIASSPVSTITFHSGAVLRAFSPTSGPFHLGGLAAVVLGSCLVLAWTSDRRWYLGAIVAGITLGLTLTRGNIIAGVFSVLALAWMAARGRERIRALGTATLYGVLVVGAAGAAVSGPPSSVPRTTPSVAPLPSVAPAGNPNINPLYDKNFRYRLQFWTEQMAAIAANPVIGYGTSAAADGFKREYALAGRMNFAPHSMYMKVPLELGLVGAGLALCIGLIGLRLWLTALRLNRIVALHIAAVVLPVAVAGLTGPMLDAYPLNLLFWSTLGWLGRYASPVSARIYRT